MATTKGAAGKKDDDAVSDMGGMAKEKKKPKRDSTSADGKKPKQR